MSWIQLKRIYSKYLNTATFALVIMPLLYDILTRINILGGVKHILASYKLVISGSLFFFLGALLSELLSPALIKSFDKIDSYREWAKNNKGEYLSRLSLDVFLQKRIEDKLTVSSGHAPYIPFNRAIEIFPSDEIASIYSTIEYVLVATSKRIARWFLTINVMVSIPLIYYLQIIRILKVLKGG